MTPPPTVPPTSTENEALWARDALASTRSFLIPRCPVFRRLDLAETASHRLNAARRLLEVTTIYKIAEADGSALSAVSEAAYLLLSDGCDLFNALAFGRTG